MFLWHENTLAYRFDTLVTFHYHSSDSHLTLVIELFGLACAFHFIRHPRPNVASHWIKMARPIRSFFDVDGVVIPQNTHGKIKTGGVVHVMIGYALVI